jgi:hypothetical protein
MIESNNPRDIVVFIICRFQKMMAFWPFAELWGPKRQQTLNDQCKKFFTDPLLPF